MKEKGMNKKLIVGAVILIAVLAAMLLLYHAFKEKPAEGSKSVTIEVVDSKGQSTMYEVKTDAEFLAQAMDDAEGFEYDAEEGPYGLTVLSVNGEDAAFEDGTYWGFFVNGEYCNYGISEQPVKDGDAFQIVYTLSE